MSYRHQLTYVGGSQSWQNIVAQLPAIPNVAWQSGTVTYADGSQETRAKYGAGEQSRDTCVNQESVVHEHHGHASVDRTGGRCDY
ncbi:hypothetical protein L3X07_07335 [Levilactobacillus brevis]|nr:hypothetical protein [Levilactobacillus brevis]